MQKIIADVMRLEKALNSIHEATIDDQSEDHLLNQAVASIRDSLDVLKERAGLADDGWKEAA